MVNPNPVSDIKGLAHSLKNELTQLGHDVPLGHVLETLSHLQGSRDWNTLKALADKAGPTAAPAQPSAPPLEQEVAAWLRSFEARPLRIWRLFPEDGGVRVQMRFGLTCEERVYSTSASDWLAFGSRLAQECGLKGFVYLSGRVWRCEAGKDADEAFALSGKRACMTTLVGRRNKNGHVLVGYALEDEPGAHPVPDYNYGERLDDAERAVDAFNDSRGVPKDEAMYIVLTSMSPEGMERP